MSNLDIPDAKSEIPNETLNNSTNVNDDIVTLLNEKIKTISESKPSVEFIIQKKFPEELIAPLKNKGYVLNIYYYYDSLDDSHHSRVKIKNPNYSNPTTDLFEKIEKQCREFGFSANTINLNDNAVNFMDMFKKL